MTLTEKRLLEAAIVGGLIWFAFGSKQASAAKPDDSAPPGPAPNPLPGPPVVQVEPTNPPAGWRRMKFVAFNASGHKQALIGKADEILRANMMSAPGTIVPFDLDGEHFAGMIERHTNEAGQAQQAIVILVPT